MEKRKNGESSLTGPKAVNQLSTFPAEVEIKATEVLILFDLNTD